jgi:thymidylate synthase
VHKLGVIIFIGVPFNIASYALLTHMVAQVCGLDVGEFIWTGGDCHIYQNHREQVERQLTRSLYQLPTLTLNADVDNIFAFTYEDISVDGYESHPAIKAKVAV